MNSKKASSKVFRAMYTLMLSVFIVIAFGASTSHAMIYGKSAKWTPKGAKAKRYIEVQVATKGINVNDTTYKVTATGKHRTYNSNCNATIYGDVWINESSSTKHTHINKAKHKYTYKKKSGAFSNKTWYTVATVTKTYTKKHTARTVYGRVHSTKPGTVKLNAYAAEKITIPAHTQYTATYDANGGTGYPASQKYCADRDCKSSGSDKVSEVIPVKKGYAFRGWNTKADGTGTAYKEGDSLPSFNTTLYAIWEVEGRTIINGSDFNSAIPEKSSAVIFTDEAAPADAKITDVSAAGDMGVVAWLDGTTFKVSTQKEGVKVIANENCSKMFYKCHACSLEGLDNIDTSNVTDMSYMFYDCVFSKSLDLSSWDTGKVSDMSYLFATCQDDLFLTSINLDGWDTSSVTNMSHMFDGSWRLQSIGDISGWDTSNVTDMSAMFMHCSNLTSLDVADWDTSNVKNMAGTFSGCSGVASLDVADWNTSNAADMSSMFYGCYDLTSLDITGWDTSSVTTMNGMFSYCRALTALDISSWNTSNVEAMSSMFYDCKSLKSINLSGWNTGKVTDMYFMFKDCKSLENVDGLANWNTGDVTSMIEMFRGCTSLTAINDISGWDTGSVKHLESMFRDCQSLEALDLSKWDTSKATGMTNMFRNCYALTTVGDLSKWNTLKVESMSGVFKDCHSLQSLNLSGWNNSLANSKAGSTTTMTSEMFVNCWSLSEVTVGSTFSWFPRKGYLPVPDSKYIDGADGYWYDTETGEGYPPTDIPGLKAATYTAVPVT